VDPRHRLEAQVGAITRPTWWLSSRATPSGPASSARCSRECTLAVIPARPEAAVRRPAAPKGAGGVPALVDGRLLHRQSTKAADQAWEAIKDITSADTNRARRRRPDHPARKSAFDSFTARVRTERQAGPGDDDEAGRTRARSGQTPPGTWNALKRSSRSCSSSTDHGRGGDAELQAAAEKGRRGLSRLRGGTPAVIRAQGGDRRYLFILPWLIGS